MINPSELNLSSIIGKGRVFRFIVFFAILAAALSIYFIEIEAFESFYKFSREHEDWQLDEYILVLFSVLLSVSFATLFATIILARRLLKEVRIQIDVERSLAQSRKLQSMGTLLAGVAHSVNNHLQPVLSLTRLVQSELPKSSDEAQHLDKVLQAAGGAASILKSVLSFSHHAHSDISGRSKIGNTIAVALDIAAAAIPSSVIFTQNIEPLQDTVTISEIDLEISLLNMITNAVDALEGKPGQINVSLNKLESVPATVLHQGKMLSAPLVCLKVSDNGKGMSEDEQIRIFDPFYTTKDVGKGTGLGLSETHGIIAKAGGVINVTSAPGEGTEIAVYVPIIE
ncbi:MAG: ATP-binding protein [Rhodospirillales bacterium]|nr:ATP-binding protein [Rhodospirillales bacterium]